MKYKKAVNFPAGPLKTNISGHHKVSQPLKEYQEH